eukprot:jgi/Hompol1/428/HPOL_000145-RA
MLVEYGQADKLITTFTTVSGLEPNQNANASTAGNEPDGDPVRQDERYTGRSRILLCILESLPRDQAKALVDKVVCMFLAVPANDNRSDAYVANMVQIVHALVKDSKIGPMIPVWDILDTIQALLNSSTGALRSDLVMFAMLARTSWDS